MSGRRNWIVNVSTDEDDPIIFGPYVRHRAEALAEQFNEKINRDNFGWIQAGAHPIQNPGIREMLTEFGQ